MIFFLGGGVAASPLPSTAPPSSEQKYKDGPFLFLHPVNGLKSVVV